MVTDGRVGIGAIEVRTGSAAPGPALVFDRAHPTGATTLDGIEWIVEPDAAPAAGHAHPNAIDDIDHVVVMASDLDRVRTALLDAGFEIRRERPTTMGDVAITQLFAWSGGVLLEVVAPTSDACASAARVWGLALTSPDIDATAAWFGDRCGAPRDAVQHGRRIATVRHRDLGLSTTIAVMTPR